MRRSVTLKLLLILSVTGVFRPFEYLLRQMYRVGFQMTRVCFDTFVSPLVFIKSYDSFTTSPG